MSLNPGEIVSSDLSPNANIQGTQIADKTLSLRNLSDDTFGIVKTGTGSLVVPDPFTTGASVSQTIAHGQSTVPAFLAYVNIPAGSGIYGDGLGPIPGFTVGSGFVTSYVQANVDSTNLTIKVTNVFGANLSGAPFGQTWTFRYYILAETAATT